MYTANYNLFRKFLMIWKNSSNIFVYLKLNFNLTIDWHNLSQFQLFGKGVEKFNSIMTYFSNLVGVSFFELGFTPCKAEQPLQSMELQENEAQRD